MHTYRVTLHDDADYQTSLTIIAPSADEARQHPLVTGMCERNDMHVISVSKRVDIA